MKFESENQLVSLLEQILKDNYTKGYLEIFKEVSLGYGTADLVLSQLTKPKHRLEPSKVALNRMDINIFNLIKKNDGVSILEIVNITKTNKLKVRKSIEILLCNNYIEKRESQFYIFQDYKLSFTANFAIEAKLKNWKRALEQAYRYRFFAEYSYVVLDDYYLDRAIKNIDVFKRYNIGLASVNTDGNLKRYFNPKRIQPFDSKMQILFSEKIRNNHEFNK